jgi:hypothetical protein
MEAEFGALLQIKQGKEVLILIKSIAEQEQIGQKDLAERQLDIEEEHKVI